MNRANQAIHDRIKRALKDPFLGIPDRIRLLLAEHEWSERELGRQAGITPNYVNAVLKGKYDPRLATMHKIAVAFRVNFEWLCLGTGPRRGR